MKYSTVRRIWSTVFVVALIANLLLISQTSQVLFPAKSNGGNDHQPQRNQQSAIPRPVVIEQLPRILKEPKSWTKKKKLQAKHQPSLANLQKTALANLLPPQRSPQQQSQQQRQPSKSIQQRSQSQSQSQQLDKETFSFCLLVKDDNDILNEWIAYHYHVLNLRQMIVAFDPSSQTSPLEVLDVWEEQFGLQVTFWNDKDYMPEYFLQKQYDLVPRMIKMEDKNASKWQETGHKVSEEHLRQDYLDINNHRFRQAKFLQKCSKILQDAGHTWMTHIDTDEYVVINPTLRQSQTVMGGNGTVPVPKSLQRGTIWKFLTDLVYQDAGFIVNWPCISMPRILFGSVEDEDGEEEIDQQGANLLLGAFDRHKMESVRWKYHADYFNRQVNKQPKVIMDVSGFPPFNISRKAFSIHRPSMKLCRSQAQMNVLDGDRYPLVVNHYLGSIERYLARDDPRRTEAAYWEKAKIKDGKDDEWIDTWLSSFVKEHGVEKVTKVLGKYMTGTSAINLEEAPKEEPTKPVKLGQTLPLENDSFSACLLLKDDNDILNEWIAYHYHVLKLRTLIVASDPSSTTSPSVFLNRWRTLMEIDEWTDESYMPDFFLQKQFHLVPSLIGNMTNSSTSQFHDSQNDMDEDLVKKDLLKVNNHRFRQATFFGSCIKDLKERNKTWMVHIDSDEYIVMHHQVRLQENWRNLTLAPAIEPSSILKFLKEATSKYSKPMSYPCVSMPRLVFGSKEDTEPGRFSNIPSQFNATMFETLRWKYHSDYDNDIQLNGKPKVILDLSGLPPKSNFLSSQVFSIHRPGLFMCRGYKDVLFKTKYKFPLTVNHYLGSWERYSHRNDARRSRQLYDVKAHVAAGKDDDWINSWVSSFVKEHGSETASRLLAEYTVEPPLEGVVEEDSTETSVDYASGFKRETPESVKTFDATKETEFSACLLVKDDNSILNEWIAYHYHVLGLRYIIVAVDAKSQTSPTELLDKWRTNFGMTIEEWKDGMFMPEMYFKKQYHLQPRLVKMKKNKHKWLEGVDDPEVAKDYFHAIQDHRFRQITFLSACTKKLREQDRSWMIHIDTDEYLVINPKLRMLPRFNGTIAIPPNVEPSIVPRLLNQMVFSRWDTINYPCISLPRLLFGSIEHDTVERQARISQDFNISRFESLRWKHHAAFEDSSLNKQPKVIMDVSAIPEDDKMLTEGRGFSIHRPSQYLCRSQGQMYFDNVEYFPFSVNHYLGSFERFGGRDDPRRNRKLYDQKANVTAGKDDEWIDGWLGSFVLEHGIEKVSDMLFDYKMIN